MSRSMISLATALVGLLWAPQAFAEKNAVQVGDVALVGASLSTADADGWTTILTSSLHTAAWSDVVVGVTLEAGLFTSTTVRSKGGTADSSTAEAKIEIQVLVDGAPADPGSVVFARRAQSLMAKFGGIVESCSDSDLDGVIAVETECTVTEEELALVLDTMGAHGFNFILADLSSGTHTIEVQARVTTSATWTAGAASASAVLGKGSVVVEEVRLAKDLDIEL